jgi:hypothetical protein
MLFTFACGLAPLAKHRVSRASLMTERGSPLLHHGTAQSPHARSLDLSAAPLVLLSPSPPACMWRMTVVQATLCHYPPLNGPSRPREAIETRVLVKNP